MKTNPRYKRGFTLVELLVVIVIIAALAGLTAPMVIRQRKKADQTEAVNNAKNIGLALFEFENDYGSYPDDTTANTILENNPDTPYTFAGNTSNDYFRQLIAAEISQSEAMFYAKAGYTKRPDGVFNNNDKALEGGEVGFGYIMNGQDAFSTAGNPSRVIAAAPLKYSDNSFESQKFDTDYYDYKAVVLRIDNSVTSLPIGRTSEEAQLGGGIDLFQNGDNTIWGDADPTMVNPEPK